MTVNKHAWSFHENTKAETSSLHRNSLENTWIKQAETYTKHFSQVQHGSSPKGTF